MINNVSSKSYLNNALLCVRVCVCACACACVCVCVCVCASLVVVLAQELPYCKFSKTPL